MELLKTGTDCKTENLYCRKSTNVIEFTIYYWNTLTKEKKKKKEKVLGHGKNPISAPGGYTQTTGCLGLTSSISVWD